MMHLYEYDRRYARRFLCGPMRQRPLTKYTFVEFYIIIMPRFTEKENQRLPIYRSEK